jgi:hypothetical protein
MKMKTSFRKSLKAVLLLAVLSISANTWAQSELKSGQVTFRYVHPFSLDYYLCTISQYGQICAGVDTNESTPYHLEMISEGRYLITDYYEKHKDYTLGYYLLSTATEDMGFGFDPAPDKDIAENSYHSYNIDINLRGHVIFVMAIHIGNSLYVIDKLQSYNISKLDELAEAGTIKKIDLNKANNFIFSFVPVEKEHGYPEESVIITAESGGTIAINDNTLAVIHGKTISSGRPTAFIPEQIKEDKTDQDEVKTGLTRFLYEHFMYKDRYLCGRDDLYIDSTIYVSSDFETNVFYLDTIGKGRYLMALNYEEKEGYSKGSYMFSSFVFPEIYYGSQAAPLSDDVLENCYYRGLGGETLVTTKAIRIGNDLYTTPEMPASMSVLNDMVQSGIVKKIDLSKTNNFIFSFFHPEDNYGRIPDGAIAIFPEIGGNIIVSNERCKIVPIGDAMYEYATFIPESVQDDDENDVGNAYIEDAVKVTLNDNTLTINSPNSERIDIYSMDGALIFSKQKPEGEINYQINRLSKGVIIVRGSSGLAKKVVK